jgi:hypothetical protein
MSHLLVRCDDQIPAWSRCPVADDAGFYVRRWFHMNLFENEAERQASSVDDRRATHKQKKSLRCHPSAARS